MSQTEDGRTKLDVWLEDQTLWLNQKQLTDLFGKAKGTICEHIKHIFEDEELIQEATVRLFRTVQKEGDREVVREVEFYNLDMVLALGFRVRSPAAVRTRQWAAHGHTAAEVIAQRADASHPHMGLTSFTGIHPRRSDVGIAKNYLDAEELEMLNRIVVVYLEFAELQALGRRSMTMAAWIQKLDDFLKLGDHDVLPAPVEVDMIEALELAAKVLPRAKGK